MKGMKKIVIFVLFAIACVIACDNVDDTTKIEGVNTELATMANFIENSPTLYNEFLEAAKLSVIPEDIAAEFGLPILENSLNNFAVRSFEGDIPVYYTAFDILNTSTADLTLFLPVDTSASQFFISTLFPNDVDLNELSSDAFELFDTEAAVNFDGSFTDEEVLSRRAELGRNVLFHIVKGTVKADEIGESITTLAGGNEIIKVINPLDESLFSFNNSTTIFGGLTDIQAGSGLIHQISRPLVIEPFKISDAFQNLEGNITVNFTKRIFTEGVDLDGLSSGIQLLLDNVPVNISTISTNGASSIILAADTVIPNTASRISLSINEGLFESVLEDPLLALENFNVLPSSAGILNLIPTNSGFEFNDPVENIIPGFRRTGVSDLATSNSDIVFSGNNSLRVTNFVDSGTDKNITTTPYSNGRLRTENTPSNLAPIPADATGTYRFQMQVYVENVDLTPAIVDDPSTPDVDETQSGDVSDPVLFQVFIRPHPGPIVASSPTILGGLFDVSINSDKIGEWQTISVDMDAATFAGFNYRIQFHYDEDVAKQTPFVFYMDDLRFFRLND